MWTHLLPSAWQNLDRDIVQGWHDSQPSLSLESVAGERTNFPQGAVTPAVETLSLDRSTQLPTPTYWTHAQVYQRQPWAPHTKAGVELSSSPLSKPQPVKISRSNHRLPVREPPMTNCPSTNSNRNSGLVATKFVYLICWRCHDSFTRWNSGMLH